MCTNQTSDLTEFNLDQFFHLHHHPPLKQSAAQYVSGFINTVSQNKPSGTKDKQWRIVKQYYHHDHVNVIQQSRFLMQLICAVHVQVLFTHDKWIFCQCYKAVSFTVFFSRNHLQQYNLFHFGILGLWRFLEKAFYCITHFDENNSGLRNPGNHLRKNSESSTWRKLIMEMYCKCMRWIHILISILT